MRTQAQMLSRKRATRVVSLGLIVVGAVTLVKTLSANDLPRNTLFDHLEVASLWFVAAGAFVGLSRIWGELAERTGPGSEKF